MAMSRPVVASTECAAAVDAVFGQELLTAGTAQEFIETIDSLLADPGKADNIGPLARQRVVERYSWEAHLGGIERYLEHSEDNKP